MIKEIGKKALMAAMTGTMIMGTMTTPVFAQWPDPGYNHITQEDRTFATNQEALDYINKYAWSIYEKYGVKLEYEVVYDGPARFRAVFYGEGYGASTPVAPSTQAPNKTSQWVGQVTVDVLNIRKWAGTEYELCSFSPLTAGTAVDVCDTVYAADGSAWYYICYNGLYGFAFADYITMAGTGGPTGPSTPVSAQFTATVAVDHLNVRTSASTNASLAKLGVLNRNMLVNVVSQDGDWYEIENNGLTGWVYGPYIAATNIQTCVDVAANANELAFANGKKYLSEETRFFSTQEMALNWAQTSETGNTLWNKYQKSLLYYVDYVGPSLYVIHFYG